MKAELKNYQEKAIEIQTSIDYKRKCLGVIPCFRNWHPNIKKYERNKPRKSFKECKIDYEDFNYT